jgi:2,4-dienoyl-CoA reductase-like NADH-dependent reductase (Old Yellow Enzyme family)
LPSSDLIRTYGAWADGGWGIVMTGNVMIDATHLGQPTDCAVNCANSEEETLASWRQWAEDFKRTGTPILMQLNHPGRQSPLGAGTRGYFAKTMAPSAIPLNIGDGLISWALRKMIFGTPRQMTKEDIRHVVARFADGARLAAEAGFAGVEIHAAHGYLLAQFLSAECNQRTDEYGGSAQNRARIVFEVVQAVRKSVPMGFCVGIKFNSVDHQSQEALQECIEQLEAVKAAGIDFLEVSGGTWENLAVSPVSLGQHFCLPCVELDV